MSSSPSAPTTAVLRPVAALRSFFSPPAVTPTAGPVDWFAAQRSPAAWSDGAGRGDRVAIEREAADRGVDLEGVDDRAVAAEVVAARGLVARSATPEVAVARRIARGAASEDRAPVAA